MESRSSTDARPDDEPEARLRILDAASTLFTSRGYSRTNTLEIARLAKVSKRDLYALIGKKEDMLKACIVERAKRLKGPEDIPPPRDRDALATRLERFGCQLLREITDPVVVSVFRLAIAEAECAPEVARTLNDIGRAASRATLNSLFTHAKAAGLIHGDTTVMVQQFLALLWENLLMDLLLCIAERPDEQTMEQRASLAATAFMQIYHAGNNQTEETLLIRDSPAADCKTIGEIPKAAL